MRRRFLRAKLHGATVTEACLEYEGSITIARELLAVVGIAPFEQVEVYNVTNGERFTTYAINGKNGEFCVNGACAHKARVGDKIIVCNYVDLEPAEIQQHRPQIAILDGTNQVKGARE